MARVRYIVHDVDAAIGFYGQLGFTVEMHPGPGFAMLRRDDLQLALNVPGGGGGAVLDCLASLGLSAPLEGLVFPPRLARCARIARQSRRDRGAELN